MSKQDTFTRLTKDLVDELNALENRPLKPSKKLRILTTITKQATARLDALTAASNELEL